MTDFMNKKIEIKGLGVCLRNFSEADIPLKVQWINDPEVSRYLHYDLPLEEEKALSWFKQVKDKEDRCDLIVQTDEGVSVGILGLLNIDYKNHSAEYYITIGEKCCWGQGVGTKALYLLLQWAFEGLGLDKIWATTRSSNLPSLSMMKKIGFSVEGRLRQEKLMGAKREDIIRVGLLREEFKADSVKQRILSKQNNYILKPVDSDLLAASSPLIKLSNLVHEIQVSSLYVKRDDLLGRVLGGNKLRKLEYILPKAIEQKADTLITTGSFESNHVCLTAATAKMLGMHPAMVLMGPQGQQETTLNERIQRKLGADIRVVYYDSDNRQDLSKRVDQAVQQLTDELIEKGRKPFFVPPAGCCLEGTYAFVEAFDELHEQMLQNGHRCYDIVLAVGTGSTFAGLWCGAKRRGADVNLYGVSIARKNPRCVQETIVAAKRVCDKLQIPIPLPEDLSITDEYIGDGYAKPTELSQQAVQMALEKEGLLLDNTYTGKAMGGMMDMIHKGEIGSRPIVFWHTGGVAGAIDSLIC